MFVRMICTMLIPDAYVPTFRCCYMRKTPNSRLPDRRVLAALLIAQRHAPRVGRVDDAVVPEAGGGKVRVALVLVLSRMGPERGLLVGADLAAPASMPSRA